ncbi:glycoside hydrolase family 43 protein [Tunicatimonas pelagia]|uniref:glycoside hydrolase family 43 protein n=1 Tax=Tunicatimonas pelagia TaxID=931531 RepID=UPI002665C9FF|nr:glycoside hydrolase 43 family protein [Tunicatimonas pelagia]WKN44200.1 glycoside hydrolase 43 family protein [Tunicatimonas pelagia]
MFYIIYNLKRSSLLLAGLLIYFSAFAQESTPPNGPLAWGDQGDGTFRNPVLFADYNNPDVIRVGDDFYMVAASHHFMGNPILHSRDMINWRIIARLWRELPIDSIYDQPGQAYQKGSWAPALVHHDGKFWVYFCTPSEGLYLTTAENPSGPWSPLIEVKRVVRWEDPYPFWDDDGQAYLLRSEQGAGPVILHKMSTDGQKILDGGKVIAYGPVLEGPKMLKRNGYYYIFAPEGGIEHGYQVVMRSKNIYGPYEKKVVLERGSTDINGPHQGAWVELENGEVWFYHFQQINGYGRVLWLEPAAWGDDGWPVMGKDYDGNGIGEPVKVVNKPTIAGEHPITVPASSDEFNQDTLGLQWLWNHNPDDAHWSLNERSGFLRLKALPLVEKAGRTHNLDSVPYDSSIIFAKNTLVQLVMGRESQTTTEMHLTDLQDSQYAGLSLFNKRYASIGVIQEDGRTRLCAERNDTKQTGPVVNQEQVWLRATVEFTEGEAIGRTYYSLDQENFTELGESIPIVRAWFEGTKYALFNYNSEDQGGTVDFNWFRYTHDGPQNEND